MQDRHSATRSPEADLHLLAILSSGGNQTKLTAAVVNFQIEHDFVIRLDFLAISITALVVLVLDSSRQQKSLITTIVFIIHFKDRSIT